MANGGKPGREGISNRVVTRRVRTLVEGGWLGVEEEWMDIVVEGLKVMMKESY